MASKVKKCAICTRQADNWTTLYPVKERVMYGWHKYLVCEYCVNEMRYNAPDNAPYTLVPHITYTAVKAPDVLVATPVNETETHVNQHSSDYSGM